MQTARAKRRHSHRLQYDVHASATSIAYILKSLNYQPVPNPSLPYINARLNFAARTSALGYLGNTNVPKQVELVGKVSESSLAAFLITKVSWLAPVIGIRSAAVTNLSSSFCFFSGQADTTRQNI